MTILDRYIARELANAWFIGLAVFVSFLAVGEVLSKGIELLFILNAPLSDVFLWFLLAMPNLVAFSLPMATLLSVVMTIGRMSHDQEITAFLSAGISFRRLLVPIVTVAVGVSVLSFLFNAFVVPPTYGAADALLWRYRDRAGTTTNLLIIEPPKGVPHLIVTAQQFNPKVGELRQVEIWERTEEDQWNFLKAERAVWRGTQWEFHDGYTQTLVPGKPSVPSYFKELSRPTSLRPPTEIGSDRKQLAPNRLTLTRLTAQIRRLESWRLPKQRVNEYVVEWHNRFALAFSCLVLAMLGAPVALWLGRGGGVAIGISVVLVILYYLAWNIGSLLGKSGSFPPMLGSHLGNLLGVVGTVWLLSRLR